MNMNCSLALLLICITLFRVAQNSVLTQEDYTLYFDEYNFDWSNADDWRVITADNTQENEDGTTSTKTIACTLHIEALKKNLCVHTKSEGGFTLKLEDFPQQNAAHIEIANDFEAFLQSQSNDDDDLEDLELDFMNDDDWSEISAIWNWNMEENQKHINENQMYNEYAQSLQNIENNVRRRLMEEEEFLGSRRRRRRRRYGRYGRYGMGRYGGMGMRGGGMTGNRMGMMGGGMMSPMSQMMMQMMQMKMMMKMMKHLMPRRGCKKPCAHAAVDDYTDYLYRYQQDNALDSDYDDDDDIEAYRRRLRRKRSRYKRKKGGFQRMLDKVPTMMMNMAMMKAMGNIMQTMNPYIAMMLLHHMRGGGGGAMNNPMSTMGMMGMHHPQSMMGMMPPQFMMNPSSMHLGAPGTKTPPQPHAHKEKSHPVKKCQPTKNGFEICATYHRDTNTMNIDVKCKNCKKKKKKKKGRKFPEKLSGMVKTLVKQHVFGHGGGVEKRHKSKAVPKAHKAPKGGKGAKGIPPGGKMAAPGAPGGVGTNAMGRTGVGMQGMNAMENAARAQQEDEYDEYDDMWRRMLMENDENLVQFDVMEGNIGYSMWRAEWMNWHNFDDYEADDALSESDTLMEYGEYRHFGNFVHYFDTFEVNWNEDDNWSDVDTQDSKTWIQFGDEMIPIDMGQKCGHKLPFLNFKLCSAVSDNDISVFFKRVSTELPPDISGAKMDDYNEYFDDFAAEYEWNDVQTLQDIIEYEFEHSLFRFSNDDDWHEIITSYPASKAGNRRHLILNEEKATITAGQRLGAHDDKATEIELFGHLYRLQGISKCGGASDSPRFCIGVHLGEPIKLPKALRLPMSKMCNFMYIAKICLGFDPNRMELKLSIQFQSIHKWKDIAKRILDVIQHLPHKVKRYTKWAAGASAARELSANNEAIDGWYDEQENKEWIISSGKVNGDNMYWDDDEIWRSTEMRNSATIVTNKGHKVERKCMHMMGDRLCFCQFLAWIDSSQYHCHPQEVFVMKTGGQISSAKGIDINVFEYIDEMDYSQYYP